MSGNQTLRGLATVSFYASDLMAAKDWYVDLLGIEPYFEQSGYVEFRIGDYENELGIVDSKYAPKGTTVSPPGSIAYWHVDNVLGTLRKLINMGAKEYEAPQERGGGFVTASVIDPFGNILGIMYNPHYLKVLKSNTKE